MNKYTIFFGNPGVGKSTLLNSLVGKALFHSGISWGKGLTSQHQIQQADNGDFFADTPGLADSKLREQAATEISNALRSGEGDYKLVFVVTEEEGRVRPTDGVTMKLILDALPKDCNVPYGIIVNKLTVKKKHSLETDREVFRAFAACLNEGREHPTAYIHLYQRVEELEDATDELHEPTPALMQFLQVLPSVHLKPAEVQDIKANEFDAQVEKLEGDLEELKNDKEKREAKLEKDREEFEKQTTEFQEEQQKALSALRDEAAKLRHQMEKNHENAIIKLREDQQKASVEEHAKFEEKIMAMKKKHDDEMAAAGIPESAINRAKEVLDDPEIKAMVAENPKFAAAVEDLLQNPMNIMNYLVDPEMTPLLMKAMSKRQIKAMVAENPQIAAAAKDVLRNPMHFMNFFFLK